MGFFALKKSNKPDPISAKTIIKKYSSFSPSTIARAIMEMTVFRLRANIERLSNAGIVAKRIAMVGGPSESPIWPQITANITGLTLKLLNGQSAGAVGAAMLAAVGAGFFKDEKEAFNSMGEEERLIEPTPKDKREYDLLYKDYYNRYEEK